MRNWFRIVGRTRAVSAFSTFPHCAYHLLWIQALVMLLAKFGTVVHLPLKDFLELATAVSTCIAKRPKHSVITMIAQALQFTDPSNLLHP
jgi:hypothetical protein